MRRSAAAAGSAAWFAVAPASFGGLVPWWLTGFAAADLTSPWAVGLVLFAAGAVVVVHAFVRFVIEGLGTPAPVAAPERLVVGGLYRHVRNPMYVAVLACVAGQALLFTSPVLVVYFAVLATAFVMFVRLYEEPALTRRFGTRYEAYKAAVPAWLPRLHPWTSG